MTKELVIRQIVKWKWIDESNVKQEPVILNDQQKKFLQQMKNFPSVIRTEFAYAMLMEGNMQKADSIKLRFEKCAKSHPYECDIKSERELIIIVEGIAKTRWNVKR